MRSLRLVQIIWCKMNQYLMWVRRVHTDLQAFFRVLDHAVLGVATHVVVDAAAVDVNLAAVRKQVHLSAALSIKQQ